MTVEPTKSTPELFHFRRPSIFARLFLWNNHPTIRKQVMRARICPLNDIPLVQDLEDRELNVRRFFSFHRCELQRCCPPLRERKQQQHLSRGWTLPMRAGNGKGQPTASFIPLRSTFCLIHHPLSREALTRLTNMRHQSKRSHLTTSEVNHFPDQIRI